MVMADQDSKHDLNAPEVTLAITFCTCCSLSAAAFPHMPTGLIFMPHSCASITSSDSPPSKLSKWKQPNAALGKFALSSDLHRITASGNLAGILVALSARSYI